MHRWCAAVLVMVLEIRDTKDRAENSCLIFVGVLSELATRIAILEASSESTPTLIFRSTLSDDLTTFRRQAPQGSHSPEPWRVQRRKIDTIRVALNDVFSGSARVTVTYRRLAPCRSRNGAVELFLAALAYKDLI